MVQHTQTIRLQKLTNCLNVFDNFVGLAPKGFQKPSGNNQQRSYPEQYNIQPRDLTQD